MLQYESNGQKPQNKKTRSLTYMLKKEGKSRRTDIFGIAKAANRQGVKPQGVVVRKSRNLQNIDSSSGMLKEDMQLLRELKDFLQSIGLGTIFGYLGRNQAILHHDILHDDPYCRELDKKGGYKKCSLKGRELMSICELCDNEANILEYSSRNLYGRLSELIERHKTCQNFVEFVPSLKQHIAKLHPNFQMLPKHKVLTGQVLPGQERSKKTKKKEG